MSSLEIRIEQGAVPQDDDRNTCRRCPRETCAQIAVITGILLLSLEVASDNIKNKQECISWNKQVDIAEDVFTLNLIKENPAIVRNPLEDNDYGFLKSHYDENKTSGSSKFFKMSLKADEAVRRLLYLHEKKPQFCDRRRGR